jgi:ATP-binding cassette, subfamily C, bacterial
LLNAPIRFIRLAPIHTFFLLLTSAALGFFQSATVLIFIPLSDLLGISGDTSNFFLLYFKRILSVVGIPYSILSVIIILVGLTAAIAAIHFLTTAYSAKISASLVRRLRLQAINSVLDARLSYLINQQSGKFVHTVLTDAGKAAAGFMNTISFLSAAVQSFVIFLTALMLDINVAFFALFSSILIIFIFRHWNNRAYQAGKENEKIMTSLTSVMTDGMGGIKSLKSMSRDHLLGPLLVNETKELEKSQYQLFLVTAIPSALREPLIASLIGFWLYFQIQSDLLEVSTLIPLALLFLRILQQMGGVISAFQAIKKMEPFLESLDREVQGAENARESWLGARTPHFKQDIAFKDASFSYGNSIILKSTSLTISKGEFIALYGPSGSGKTTFVDILCGHIPLTSGDLLVDGESLLALDIQQWRKVIGYVPQDLYLFHDSIARNVSLGDPNIDNTQIEWALEKSGILDVVNKLPQRENTIVGERGLRFSGGQRQRIAIARALVTKPQLLILDEATNALDSGTEREILHTIYGLCRQGTTVIAVSHQPAVLDIADTAYNLIDGNLIEFKGDSTLL